MVNHEKPAAAGRRRLPDPSTSSLLQPPQGNAQNLDTLSLFVVSRLDDLELGESPGRITHIPLRHIGSGKTFSAAAVDLGRGAVRVIKRPRFHNHGNSPMSADEVEASRTSLAQSIFLEFSVLTHPPLRTHENILKLFGVGWETDPLDGSLLWPVLVVELAEHGTLLDMLTGSAHLPLLTKRSLIEDVACGLSAIHGCGVVHGDIKCSNILVFASEHREHRCVAKLADFGYSLLDGKSETSLVGSTWPWNPPEWRQKLERASLAKADVYSFALLVMQTLENGDDPFSRLTNVAELQGRSRVEAVERLKTTDSLLPLLKQRVIALCTESAEIANLMCGILELSVWFDPDYRSLTSILILFGHEPSEPDPNLDRDALSSLTSLEEDSSLFNIESVFRRRSLDIPHEAQHQVIRGLQQLYENESLAPSVRGCAALQVAFSYVSGYGQEKQDLDQAAQWITSAGIWEKLQPLRFRYLHAFGKSDSEVDDDDTMEKLGMLAVLGSRIALQEIKRRDAAVFGRLLALLREYTDYPGVTEFPRETIAKFTVTDIAKLKEQIQATEMPASEIRPISSKSSLLHYAAFSGAIEAVEYLIQHGCEVDLQNSRGRTPLLLACQCGHHEVALKLLNYGVDGTLRDELTNETPLHMLVYLDDDQISTVFQAIPTEHVKATLHISAEEPAHGNTISVAFGDGPPLRWAVVHNKVDYVRLLLEAGADPWQDNPDGSSAIEFAALLHRASCLSVILKHNSSRQTDRFKERLSRLLAMAILGSIQHRMLVHGAEYVGAMTRSIDVLIRHGASLSTVYFHGIEMTALYAAVKYATSDIVSHLLKVGLEFINTRCEAFGYTPLHEAILRGNSEIFHLLLEHGADPAIPWEDMGMNFSTIFVCTKSMREDESVRMADHLLETTGPQMLSDLIDGISPLDMAIQFQQYRLADCFRKWGADINREYDFAGRTYTLLGHIICGKGAGKYYISALRYLLSGDNATRPSASFIVRQRTGETAFQCELRNAIGMDRATSQTRLLFLVSKFRDKKYLEHEDMSGMTALQLATYLGHFYAVKIFVDEGADINKANNHSGSFYYGMTVLDTAYLSLDRSPYNGFPSHFMEDHSSRVKQIIQVLRAAGARRLSNVLPPSGTM
ncbi:hypothetical protein EDB81DRAFT_374573 [Dactylonectria macrodidyma]|uniref:Protein kinase domain-containing protein n=1 Tax=Dactylonectria macrodidyma TaxID=307937 RepID=A0A9P9D012_9HYPO|nr:hypothetical protein EDB81DRAFT_374573 [Dactylonectria macrodidyma]